MAELDFIVEGVEPARHAIAPTLCFRLGIRQHGRPVSIQGVSLQCQLRIDPGRRAYRPSEQQRLRDLFGAPERWGRTLQGLLWTHVSLTVPAFKGAGTEVELPVPCSFDFNIATTKYFHGLEQGVVPVMLLFSGSVFYRDGGSLAMAPIARDREAGYDLPVDIWQRMMERYYPDSNWLCLNRQVFEALYDYKRRHGYIGFDEALTGLLAEGKREAS